MSFRIAAFRQNLCRDLKVGTIHTLAVGLGRLHAVNRPNMVIRAAIIFWIADNYAALVIGYLTAVLRCMKSKLIDPKLDVIPAEQVELTAAESEKLRHQKPIRGLSINDTIANSADHSVGARGVETSDVESGEPKHPDITIATTTDDRLS